MKRFFQTTIAAIMLCVAASACYQGADGAPEINLPTVKQITDHSATVSAMVDFKGAVEQAGVVYINETTDEQRFAYCTLNEGINVTLENLDAATDYTAFAVVSVSGTDYESQRVNFTTLSEGESPSNPNPGNPNPEPNKDVKYSGWAELPAEQPAKSGDYYYAYHMRADASSVRNFSVCYSKKYMCPIWVAAPMHSCYKGSTKRTDSYGNDPKIPFSQVHKRDGYTRGHMLGSSDRTISRETNKQVFYLSNIAPQLSSGFNTGGGVWNNLEEMTDSQWCTDTLYQVIGCYWENTNKHSSGTTIPTHYYKALLRTKKGNSGKWVANCSRDELKCVVFMVEHNSSQHRVKPHKGMMMSVSECEKLTGLTLFPNVPNAPKDSFTASEWGIY